jgi:hypothetical protein
MIHPNGHDPSTATIPAPAPVEAIKAPPDIPSALERPIGLATRTKLRSRQHFQQNRFVIIGAGALVVALLIFVATSIPHKSPVQKAKGGSAATKEEQAQTANASVDRSLFPITDSGRPSTKESHEGFLNEKDLERSVTRRFHPTSIQPGPSNAPGTLGSIPPFGPDQPGWQAPPYQAGAAQVGIDGADIGKAEREAMEKSSLVYVRTVSATQAESQSRDRTNLMTQRSASVCPRARDCALDWNPLQAPRCVRRYWQSSNTPMNGRDKWTNHCSCRGKSRGAHTRSGPVGICPRSI